MLFCVRGVDDEERVVGKLASGRLVIIGIVSRDEVHVFVLVIAKVLHAVVVKTRVVKISSVGFFRTDRVRDFAERLCVFTPLGHVVLKDREVVRVLAVVWRYAVYIDGISRGTASHGKIFFAVFALRTELRTERTRVHAVPYRVLAAKPQVEAGVLLGVLGDRLGHVHHFAHVVCLHFGFGNDVRVDDDEIAILVVSAALSFLRREHRSVQRNVQRSVQHSVVGIVGHVAEVAAVEIAEARHRAHYLAARVLLDEYAGYRRVKVFAVRRDTLNVSVRAHVAGH